MSITFTWETLAVLVDSLKKMHCFMADRLVLFLVSCRLRKDYDENVSRHFVVLVPSFFVINILLIDYIANLHLMTFGSFPYSLVLRNRSMKQHKWNLNGVFSLWAVFLGWPKESNYKSSAHHFQVYANCPVLIECSSMNSNRLSTIL